MATKILFTFTAQDIGVAKAQDDIKDRLSAINKEIKASKAAGSPYGALLGETTKLKREATSLREEQAKLNKEFKATTVPKDSLTGLRLEYSKLTDQVNKLSAAERNSSFGRNLIKNASTVKKDIDGIEQSLGRFTGNVGNYKSAISGISRLLPLLGVGLGAGEIVASTREFEKLFAVLKQATGNESAATKIFKDIQEFAKETPFQINELVGAFVKLENRNFNPTIEQLRTIGDIAASQGKTVDQFTEAILDAQTGEFERLKEFGIVARKNGDDVRVSFRGQSESFKNTTENVTKYLLKIGELPGIQGSAVAVSKTLDGSLSNLVDNFTQLFAKIGSSGGAIKFFVDGINLLVGSINDLLDTPLSEEIGKQQREFNSLIGVLSDTNTKEEERGAIIKTLKAEYPQYLKFVNDDAKGQIDLAKTLEFGNSLFEQRILLQATEEERTKLTKDRIKLENDLSKALIDQQKAKGVNVRGAGPVRNDASDLSQVENVASNSERIVFETRNRIAAVNQEITDLIKTSDDTALRTTGKTIAQLSAELDKTFGDKETKDSGPAGKAKALAGSLDALNESLEKVQKKINNTPGSSPLLAGLVKDSVDLDKKIKSIEALISEIRNPSVELTDEQRGLELATGIDPEQALKEAKRLRDQLGAELGGLAAPEEFSATDALAAQLDSTQAAKDKAAADKKLEDQKDLNELIKEGAIQSAQNIADAVFEIQQNQLKKEQDAKLAALNEQEAKAIEAANGNAAKEKVIRADFEKKRAALEKKFANERKELARKEALINIALSITKAFTGGFGAAGFVLAGIAAIAGAAQLAVINSQEFAGGGTVKRLSPGIVKEKQNAPRTANGDTVLAYLKPGEMVLNQAQQSNIAGIAGSDVFQRAGVPGVSRSRPVPFFASGGVVDFVPQTSFARDQAGSLSLSAQATFAPDQVKQIGSTLGNIIAVTVANEVKRAMAEGLDDANRRLERENDLQTQRQG